MSAAQQACVKKQIEVDNLRQKLDELNSVRTSEIDKFRREIDEGKVDRENLAKEAERLRRDLEVARAGVLMRADGIADARMHPSRNDAAMSDGLPEKIPYFGSAGAKVCANPEHHKEGRVATYDHLRYHEADATMGVDAAVHVKKERISRVATCLHLEKENQSAFVEVCAQEDHVELNQRLSDYAIGQTPVALTCRGSTSEDVQRVMLPPGQAGKPLQLEATEAEATSPVRECLKEVATPRCTAVPAFSTAEKTGHIRWQDGRKRLHAHEGVDAQSPASKQALASASASAIVPPAKAAVQTQRTPATSDPQLFIPSRNLLCPAPAALARSAPAKMQRLATHADVSHSHCNECGRRSRTFTDASDGMLYCQECWMHFYGQLPEAARAVHVSKDVPVAGAPNPRCKPGGKFKCRYCPNTFTRASEVRRHVDNGRCKGRPR